MKTFWLVSLLALATIYSVSVAASAQTVDETNNEADNTARIHYTRPDGAYKGWRLHVWEDTTQPTEWENGLEISGETSTASIGRSA